MTETFTSTEYKLYGRQMLLPELGTAGQLKLKKAHVLVVGAGGLGAPALLYLAGAGVGTITVVDDDQVELSNLHRQVVHSFATVGNSKAESAAASLRALNPTIAVRTIKERLTEANAQRLLGGVDAVLDGSDNFSTRYTVSEAAARFSIPHIWGAILGFDAQMSVFWAGRGPVYEDLYPMAPAEGSVPTCSTAGVMGAMAGVVGTSMAMEAIKVLAEIGTPLMGQVGYYSALEGRWDYIPLKARQREVAAEEKEAANTPQNAEPQKVAVTKRHIVDEFMVTPVQAEKTRCTYAEYRELAQLEDIVLLDVREPAEFAALSLPGAQNLPLSVLEELKQKNQLKSFVSGKYRLGYQVIVVYCVGGPRAGLAAQMLRDAGGRKVYEMTDGLPGWLMSQKSQ